MHTTKQMNSVCMIIKMTIFWKTNCTLLSWIVESAWYNIYILNVYTLSNTFKCVHIMKNDACFSLQLMVIT